MLSSRIRNIIAHPAVIIGLGFVLFYFGAGFIAGSWVAVETYETKEIYNEEYLADVQRQIRKAEQETGLRYGPWFGIAGALIASALLIARFRRSKIRLVY